MTRQRKRVVRLSEYKTLGDWKWEFDVDSPNNFCPICGSDDITSNAFYDYAKKVDVIQQWCNNCDWGYQIVVFEKGKKKFKIRKDKVDCKICKGELERYDNRP